jgi:hypothetical protein
MRQTFALDENIGGVENYVLQTFAPDQNLGGFKIVAENLCALQNNKKSGGWSK